MMLGLRGHDLDKNSPAGLAANIAERGFNAVQLAVAKSFDFHTGPGTFTEEKARDIRDAFQKEGVTIAVLGCYIQMIHPDPSIRRAELDRFKEHIAVANTVGCLLVGTETGNVHAAIHYTPDNFAEAPFQAVVESVKELAAEAEHHGVMIGIEAGVNHPIYSPETMKRMLDIVDSPNIRVIMDPVNLLTPDTWEQQTAIYEQAFSLYGDKIDVLHAKDVALEDGQLQAVPVGSGLIDYDAVFRLMKQFGRDIPILLEDVREPYIEESQQFLKGKITVF